MSDETLRKRKLNDAIDAEVYERLSTLAGKVRVTRSKLTSEILRFALSMAHAGEMFRDGRRWKLWEVRPGIVCFGELSDASASEPGDREGWYAGRIEFGSNSLGVDNSARAKRERRKRIEAEIQRRSVA